MADERERAERQRLKDGVFQPSRADIAREMKCRLDFRETKPAKAQQAH